LITEAAAAAADFDEDFSELFAKAGTIATANIDRVATRIGRTWVLLFVSIENLLEWDIAYVQKYHYSKAYAWEIHRENTCIIKLLDSPSKVGHVGGHENGKKTAAVCANLPMTVCRRWCGRSRVRTAQRALPYPTDEPRAEVKMAQVR
jgi:hypothetical protein